MTEIAHVEGLDRVLRGEGIRYYGRAWQLGKHWEITGEPQMLMMFKRLFRATGNQQGILKIDSTPMNAELVEWFLYRYPLEMSGLDASMLKSFADEARRLRAAGDDVLRGSATSFPIETKIPLRNYQTQAVQMLLLREALLCGDDLGLGKTCVALGAIAAGLQPALVVCKTHLQQQWVNEANKFLHGVKAHIVKSGFPYQFPEHNVAVMTYHKLNGQAEALNGYKLIVFDEAQELRRRESAKYTAAQYLCGKIPYRLALSATPIYNYGDEIFNIINLLAEGSLGSRSEFLSEWCDPMGGHHKVREPVALGGHLAEQHFFLRRRRKEVGRELPAVTRVVEEVEYNDEELLKNEDKALELAKTVLRGEFTARGRAALELDMMLRMQTGIAKAPFVAEFVRQMVETGEPVVLCGWHREVYTVWQRIFAMSGVSAVLYTGSESPTQKHAAVSSFVKGDASVFILSLRSGEGLNGLQERSSVIVFGEFDWSPQVHEQCIGRLNRDGQTSPVTAVYLHSGGGSDPVIAQVHGIKRNQSDGIINPEADSGGLGEQVEVSRVSELARRLLANTKRKHVEIATESASY